LTAEKRQSNQPAKIGAGTLERFVKKMAGGIALAG
jgi:hypothetical protein